MMNATNWSSITRSDPITPPIPAVSPARAVYFSPCVSLSAFGIRGPAANVAPDIFKTRISPFPPRNRSQRWNWGESLQLLTQNFQILVPSELKFDPRNGWRMSFAPQAWVLLFRTSDGSPSKLKLKQSSTSTIDFQYSELSFNPRSSRGWIVLQRSIDEVIMYLAIMLLGQDAV